MSEATDSFKEMYLVGIEATYVGVNVGAEEAWDDMITEVERAAAARALEEAADEIFAQHDEITAMQREAFHRGADAVYDALRARAAEMREGKSE